MTPKAFAEGAAGRRALANAASVAAGLAPPPDRAQLHREGNPFNIRHQLVQKYNLHIQPAVIPVSKPPLFDIPIDYNDCRMNDTLYEKMGGVQRDRKAGKPPMQDVRFSARCIVNPLIISRDEYKETDYIGDCPIYVFIITPGGHAFILISTWVEQEGGIFPMAFSLGIGIGDDMLPSGIGGRVLAGIGIYSPDPSFTFEKLKSGYRIIDVGLFKKKHADRIEQILQTQEGTLQEIDLNLINMNFNNYLVNINGGKYSLLSFEGGINNNFYNCVSFAQFVFSERVVCVNADIEHLASMITLGLLRDPRISHPESCKNRAGIDPIALYAETLDAFFHQSDLQFSQMKILFYKLNADTIHVSKTGRTELCYNVGKRALCALLTAGSVYTAWRFISHAGGGKTRRGKMRKHYVTRHMRKRFKALEV